MNDAPSSPPRPFARRMLALSLPYLPTDRILRQLNGRSWLDPSNFAENKEELQGRETIQAPAPLAVVAKIKSALRIVALDESAERLGLTRGQALADARAMIPALGVADDDPDADIALLELVADWAERYTPLVALISQHGLMLDITGCAHLFGGESALVADLVARLHGQGFHARAAIADTPGAASAAARFGTDSTLVVPPGGSGAMLAPLPLAALRLDHDTIAALDRVGLKRIGQIVGSPRAPLAARFGRSLIAQLDRALGIDEEAIDPRRPAPAMLAERRFAEPIGLMEDIAAVLSSLAATLGRTLETRGLGARLLELSLFRVDGAVARLAVGAGRPMRDAKRVLALFREKFASLGDELDAGFGFDMARLAVLDAAPMDAAQIDLTGDAAAEADLDGLVDRIGARLGGAAVSRIVARDSHIPERAEALAADDPSSEGGGGTARRALGGEQPSLGEKGEGYRASGDWENTIVRPLRLFARPEPVEAVAEVPDGPPARFRWRRALYHVARAEGPERIAAEWWRDDDLTRDYFRVEDDAGHRFWLFREGLYGRETTAPRWYMHGVFA
jgi:protein ImuB